jgi:hypothetical protein
LRVAFLRVAFLRVAFFLVAFFLAMIIDLLVSTMRALGPLADVPPIEFYTYRTQFVRCITNLLLKKTNASLRLHNKTFACVQKKCVSVAMRRVFKFFV